MATVAPPSGNFANRMNQTGPGPTRAIGPQRGDVTISAFVPINYRVPPPPGATYDDIEWRVNAFGRQHTGGPTSPSAMGVSGSCESRFPRLPCGD